MLVITDKTRTFIGPGSRQRRARRPDTYQHLVKHMIWPSFLQLQIECQNIIVIWLFLMLCFYSCNNDTQRQPISNNNENNSIKHVLSDMLLC